MLEKLIAYPRNSSEPQVLPVFVEDAIPVIQSDSMSSTHAFKRFDTLQLALQIRMGISPIRRYGDVGIHNTDEHYDKLIRLSRDALLIAAISPISSPKK